MNISSAIELYILDCQIRRLRTRSMEHYNNTLNLFRVYCEHNSIETLDQITNSVIQKYQQQFSSKSPVYVKNTLVVINVWLKFCKEENVYSNDIKIRYPRVQSRVKKAFTANEIKTVLSCCKLPVWRLIIQLMLDTGIRLNELRQLDVIDVDISQGLILVKHGKTGERYIAIGVKVRKELIKYLNGRRDGPLLLSQYKQRFSTNGLSAIFKVLRERSGIKHCSSHTCRRTFATSMSRQGMNIHILAKLMGHSDVQTLKQYLDITNEDLKQEHAKFSPVDNL